MITSIVHKHKGVSPVDAWKKELAFAIRDPLVLLSLLDLEGNAFKSRLYQPEKFKLFVPRSYVNKMKKGDWNDPLLKQILPIVDENNVASNTLLDPVGDLASEVSAGLLHKYQGRVLLVTTGACAVHCRYCFRQHFPYAESVPDKRQWQHTLSYIKDDSSLSEVILSGGDPLMLSDDRLQRMCADLSAIPHVKTLRFHTRVPVFLPERIHADFLSWMEVLPLRKVMVIHANHANELDKVVQSTLTALHQSGFTLLNQSVLLKGVNDNTDALVNLSQRLFDMHVMPYYLHQLDKVQGAAHFSVSKTKALSLVNALKDQLPGYLVPKFVEEVSGKRSKQSVV